MDGRVEIIEVTPDNVEKYGFCTFYKNPRTEGFQNKLKWFTTCYRQGLKYKAIYSSKDEATMGMIEYVPGEYNWRSIDAKNHMVIHLVLLPMVTSLAMLPAGSLILRVSINSRLSERIPEYWAVIFA
jgi:hypothetical protein